MIDYISKKTSRVGEKRLSTTVLHLPIDRAVAAAAVGSDAWMPAAGMMIATSVSALPATDGDGSDGRNRRHRSPSSSGRVGSVGGEEAEDGIAFCGA